MPERYALSHSLESIVAHAAVAAARGDRPVHAALVPSRRPEVAELCVVAEDRPGLLARIAAAITEGRLEVLAAQVYSRPRDPGTSDGRAEAVDLFWVRDRSDGAPAVERAMPRLLRDLDAVCRGQVEPDALLAERASGGSRWRERPSPAVDPEVVLDNRASDRHTVVEVFAKDRPGLLYTLARAFRTLGLSIATSKINTEGARVADVFYVAELDGSKIATGERSRLVRAALLGAIGEK
jgi:[protein-PII] uridylyltransferase